METWREHIAEALSDPSRNHGLEDGAAPIDVDPDLRAHFDRAHALLERMGRERAGEELSERVSRSECFALLTTPGGQVLAASPSALAVLGKTSDMAALDMHLAAHSARLLRDLMRDLREGREADAPLVLATGTRPRFLIVRGNRHSGTDTDPAILIEELDFTWTGGTGRMLAESFGLSPAEIEVVRNLMTGYALREIAERTGRSEHTVRNQAKAVLAKTGAPSQVDLIRLVALLIRTGQEAEGEAPGYADLSHEVLRMRSGLEMQVFHAGDPAGRPVIFLHGMQDGMAPLRFLDPMLAQRGIRVIAPVRPGYGRSDPLEDAEAAMESFLDHVAELVSRLAPERPVLLGYMAGAISGHILAGRIPGDIAGMLTVSGAAPIVRAGDLATIAPRQRAVAYTARYAPSLLPFVLRAGIAQIDGKGFDAFLDGVFPPGTHDHAVIRRLGLKALIREGYRFSVRQGYAGFAADARHAVSDWRIRVRQPAARAVLLHGAGDRVVTPDMIRAFAKGQPHTTLRLVPGVAQLVLYERPQAVLDALDELSGAAEGVNGAG